MIGSVILPYLMRGDRPASVRYLSLCSGIEAATVAWHSLGWIPVAFCEFDAFPSAVLAHHWPHVPNLGDMTKWREWDADMLAQVDVLVGGTPCQAFSVAGLRNSLNDERGNLTLIYAHILDRIDTVRRERGLPPCVCLWENVPGVLSTKDNAFGCFLGALAGEDEALVPSGKKWTNAGYVRGPERAIAWRTLDAQYFGVAQRRRRVFVVASAREGFCPAAVLFESEGVRRDSAPSRETGQGIAGGFECGPSGGGFTDLAPTLDARCKDGPIRNQIGAGVAEPCFWNGEQVTQTLDAVLSKGQTMPEKNRFPAVLVPSNCLTPDLPQRVRIHGTGGVAPTLSSEHGRGHGVPTILAPAVLVKAYANKGHFGSMLETEFSDPLRSKGGDTGNGGESLVAFMAQDYHEGTYVEVSEAGPLTTSADRSRSAPVVAYGFNGDQSAQTRSMGEREEQCPTLRADGPAHVAVAYGCNGDETPKTMKELSPTLRSEQGGEGRWCMTPTMAVRRLTPTECARLQGFPDHHARIPWRGKTAEECPDGPQYKCYGNSMAVPVIHWLGTRIFKSLKP